MKTFNKAFYFPLLFLILLFTNLYATVTNDYRDFSRREQLYFRGDMQTIGNTVLVAPVTQNNTICDTYTNGAFIADASGYNNNYYLCGYQVDSGTTNSTTSELVIPASATIKWAGLYWQALVANDDFSTAMTIKIKKDSGNYNSISYDDLDYLANSGKNGYTSYSAFKDLTSVFTNNNWGSGNYTVADIPVHEGMVSDLGTYGAWTLVIVYEDTVTIGQKFRSFSIFDGWKVVKNNDGYRDIQVDISGFYTPESTPISAKVSVFAAEGDKNIINDRLRTFNYNTGASVDLTPPGVTNQTFNSTISGGNTRTPYAINNMGIDIQTFEIGDYLTKKQTDMEFHLLSTQDTYWPSLFAFSTELYVPEFCYDYAYKQQNKYFTEENDGSSNPKIVGDVIPHEPVQTTVFLRNLVESDIIIDDMIVNITDINTTQATYITNTTSLAKIPSIVPTPIPESDISTSDGSISGIEINFMGSNDYFYIYYDLDPKVSHLDMPLNVTANYTLTAPNGEPIPYTLTLGPDIPLCATSNFDYKPVEGRFNIVHSDYYTWNGSTGSKYYNLPTQVTSREGNFKVISLDPDDMNALQAIPNNTKIAVEMIDISAFHDTFTACKELESAITPRVWVTIDANSSSTPFNAATLFEASQKQNATYGANSELPNGWDFYKSANENTAFRISYNLDDNESFILQYNEDNTTNPPRYEILNFPGAAQTGRCSHPVNFFPLHGNLKTNVTQAATACGNAGNKISESQFDACNECLYGKNTALVCSRDNFSIRPEALLVKLDDQNQTNQTTYIRLDEDGGGIVSGVESPTDRVLNIAAGYNYHMEVNATNHRGNEASPGYTKTYGITNDDKAHFIWDNNNSKCNDETNHEFEIRFLEGYVETNISVDQVGRYRLNKIDKEWTTVDSDPNHMTHHTGPNFLSANNPDCILGSTITQTVGATAGAAAPMQGCEIWSEHDSSFITNLKYRDYKLESHPYKFTLKSIKPTVGLNHTDINATSYIYMADMSSYDNRDQNMSYHLDGFIVPQGYNDSNLSNFVEGCFAKQLNINISNDGTALNDENGNQVVYQLKFHDINSTTDAEISALTLDRNFTIPTSNLQLQTGQNYFKKEFNGSMETRLNLNYYRTNNVAVNPKEISFISYDVECSNPVIDCNFKADLVADKKTKGTKDLNSTIKIKHYYGRTHAPRNRFVGNTGNAFIYYEVYCNNTAGNTPCNKALLQNGLSSRVTDDPRWFKNEAHTVARDGNASIAGISGITQKNGTRVGIAPGVNLTDIVGRTTIPLTYDKSRGYPYKATMENNASGWLIYNQYNPAATVNEFEVEFVNTDSNWAGKAKSSATTQEIGSKKTNRRSMW